MHDLDRRQQFVSRRLAEHIIEGPAARTRRWAVVDATHTGPNRVDITMNGVPIAGVRYLASYSPSGGDTVIVWIEDNDPIVLGKLA